jgi:hypothetical protein
VSHESIECFGVRSDFLRKFISSLGTMHKMVGDPELSGYVQGLRRLVSRYQAKEFLSRRLYRMFGQILLSQSRSMIAIYAGPFFEEKNRLTRHLVPVNICFISFFEASK